MKLWRPRTATPEATGRKTPTGPDRKKSIEEAIPVPVEIAGQWAWRILAVVDFSSSERPDVRGSNHDEIADILSIPPSSSRVYLSRAKEKLRKLIRIETQNHG